MEQNSNLTSAVYWIARTVPFGFPCASIVQSDGFFATLIKQVPAGPATLDRGDWKTTKGKSYSADNWMNSPGAIWLTAERMRSECCSSVGR